jgi:hypothetical protein
MSDVFGRELDVSIAHHTPVGRKRWRGTYGDVPFISVGGTFLVVEGDGVDMRQEAIISTDRYWGDAEVFLWRWEMARRRGERKSGSAPTRWRR